MSFNGTEVSKDLGSPFELYLFRYGDPQEDEIGFQFSAVPTPTIPVGAKVTFTQFSHNGKVLVTTYDQFPFMSVYRRESDDTFTEISYSGALLAKPTCIAFNQDDTHMAIGMVNADSGGDPPVQYPNLALYVIQYTSGGELAGCVAMPTNTENPNRPVDNSGQVHSVCYSTDGQHLLVGHDGFPYLTFYTRSGVTYTKFEALVQNAPGPCLSIDFASSDTCVVTTASAAPIMYHRAGTSYTRAAIVPLALGAGETIQSAAFSPDGTKIVVCRSGPPYASFYSRSGNTLAPMLAIIGGGPASKTYRAIFDSLGEGLLIAEHGFPYVTSYEIKDTVVVRTDEWQVVQNGPVTSISGSLGGDNKFVSLGSLGEQTFTIVERITTINDGALGYYAYTNAERDMTLAIEGMGSITFTAIPINRDAYKSNGKILPTTMNVKMPLLTDLAALFLPFPPPQPVGIAIYQGHHDDVDHELTLVWTGKVLTVARERNEAVITCDNNIVSMGRLGLRRNYQFGCPYVLYGSLCKASKANASVKAVVVSIVDGNMVLTANWWGGRNPADFSGGLISWQSKIGIEYRTLKGVTAGGAITYVGPLRNIEPGTEVTITLGCNHQRSHCTTLHNNINNFGGQPWIPLKNPVKYHPFW